MSARAGAAAQQPAPEAQPEQLLKRPTFRAYWLSRLLSQTAQGALLYGLFVLIVDRTDRSIYGSLFVLCSTVPSLLFGLVGGWVADRVPGRPYLVALNFMRAGLVLLLLRTAADLPTFFLVTLGVWTVHQFFSPAEAAAVPRLVPPERLSAGASMSNLALTIAQILGMVILAPLLLKLPDPRFLFGVSATLYALGGVLDLRLGPLRGREDRLKQRQPLTLRHGWRVVIGDPPSFAALIDNVLIGIGMSTLVVIVPYYLQLVLHSSPRNTVFVFAPAVLGVVIGLQLAPLVGNRIGHGRTATIGLIGFAVAVAGFGLIDQVVELLQGASVPLNAIEARVGVSTRISGTMVLSIPAGFFASLTNIGSQTVLLDRSPERARGQVLATQNVITNAGALLPTLAAGLAIDQFHVRPVALSIAFLLLAVALLARWYGARQHVEHPPRARDDDGPVAQPADAGVMRFIEQALVLKDVRRQGWLDRDIHDPESVADHSWSVALLAWVLSKDHPELDRGRVMLLALAHDLPEALAGDRTPFDAVRTDTGEIPAEYFRLPPRYSAEAKRLKHEAEAAALEEVLRDLPATQAAELRDAWREYDAGLTREARFVKQIDKLETLAQAEAYREAQPSLVVDSFWIGADRDVTDARIKRLFPAIGRGRGARRKQDR